MLVDLDVQFGDVASALALTPEYTLPDAVHGPASEDTMVLKTFLTQHPSGLYAVCGAESPAAGDTVTADDVSRLLTSLAREFRYVVVDTAPGLSPQTLAALDRASDVVMLTSMDVPGVRGLRKELDVLRELCMIPAGRHVVMNFADPKGGLSVRDVETGDRHRRRRRPAALGVGAAVDQPGRAAAARAAAGATRWSRSCAGWCPLRGHPAHEAGRGRARHRAAAVNLADRLAAAQGLPDAPPAAAAPPARCPRPAAAAPAAPHAGPAAAGRRARPGSRTGSARRCSSAWAPGSTTRACREQQLRTLVLGELDEVVEEEKVPLSDRGAAAADRRARRRRAGPRPAAAAARRRRGHRDHGQRPRQRSTSSGPAGSSAPPARFTSEEHLRRVIDRIVSQGGPAHRRVLAAGRRPAGRRLARQRDHPAAGVQRVDADHPQVRQGPVHRRRPDRLRHAVARRWPSCSTPASRPG